MAVTDKLLDGSGLSHLASTIKGELADKQDELVSGTNIKTINNNSLLGSGNLTISGEDPSVAVSTTEPTGNEVVWINPNGSADTFATVATTGDYDDLIDKPTFKTINNESILGSGNIEIDSGDVLPEIETGDAGKVLTVNSTEDGVEWAEGGGGTPTNMVTTDTAQTITGKKTFNSQGIAFQGSYGGNTNVAGVNAGQVEITGNNSGQSIIVYADTNEGIYPNSTSSNQNLGKSTNLWNTLYASNLSDGTTTKTMSAVLAGGGGGSSYTFTDGLTEQNGVVSNDLKPLITFNNGTDSTANILIGISNDVNKYMGGIVIGTNISKQNQYSDGAEIQIGYGLKANGSKQITLGRYNVVDNTKYLILGDGDNNNTRHNILTVDKSGNLVCNNIPAPPSVAGSYNLHCEVDSSGNATYSWI